MLHPRSRPEGRSGSPVTGLACGSIVNLLGRIGCVSASLDRHVQVFHAQLPFQHLLEDDSFACQCVG